MTFLLKMYEDSQKKLEEQLRENTTLRLHLKDLEMAEKLCEMAGSGTAQPQDLMDENNNYKTKNEQIKQELKAAYSEIAELK